MRKSFLFPLIIFSLCFIYYSCSKSSGDDNPGQGNPCANVTVVVNGSSSDANSGQSNGSISASATGGSGFTYNLNGGAFQSSGSFTNLAAGTYTISAKNSDGCTGSKQFTINTAATNNCGTVNIVVTPAVTNATPCQSPANGSIIITATGSTNFQYSINGGTSFQSSNTFNSLAEGSYNIEVKDGNGCSKTGTAVVGAASAGPLFAEVRTIVRANCAISGCHSGSSPQNGLDFSNDCVVITNKTNIKARAVDHNPSQMPPPPNPALSTAQKAAITNWINAGGNYSN